MSVISLMSAPAANARSPAPVRTRTRASVSVASSRSPSRSSESVSRFSAFSASGRSRTTTATPPSLETWTGTANLQLCSRHSLLQEIHDLLGRLVEAGVDHLHTGVPEGAGDDLRPSIVPVQSGLGDHYSNPLRHQGGSIR